MKLSTKQMKLDNWRRLPLQRYREKPRSKEVVKGTGSSSDNINLREPKNKTCHNNRPVLPLAKYRQSNTVQGSFDENNSMSSDR